MIHPYGVCGYFPEGHCLDARYTLKKNSDFRRLYSKGKSAVTPYLVLYSKRNGHKEKRAGFTVSVKLGHAVTRNRIRRQLRAVYRLNSDAIRPGTDVVIVARSRCIGADFHVMEAAFLSACGKLGILVKEDGEDA